MNITVYLGAKEGNDPALKRAVQELGQWIGQSGNALVYGGSKTGLMAELPKAFWMRRNRDRRGDHPVYAG